MTKFWWELRHSSQGRRRWQSHEVPTRTSSFQPGKKEVAKSRSSHQNFVIPARQEGGGKVTKFPPELRHSSQGRRSWQSHEVPTRTSSFQPGKKEVAKS